MGIREQMESIYRELPLDQIPWNFEEPPHLLVDLVQTRRIAPCDAVDIGCGCGNYAVWLAAQGFRMTGIDISSAAIALAGQLARERGVECRFVEGDVTEDVTRHEGAFDLGYDWEVLHHVFPENREAYVNNVHRMLRPRATHLSVCFSEEDPDFRGTGKYRQTPLGTTLYCSSEEEIDRLFSQKFQILELHTTAIVGKYGPHTAVVALLERR
jgi:cyclopropane fatty-acyl-phospholipid synthase-like methyltransferase